MPFGLSKLLSAFAGLLLGMLLSAPLLAQRPGGTGGQRMTGRVYGKVFDASTRKPAEFATVAAYTARQDSLLTGTITRSNGDFTLDQVPVGELRLRVSFIGYKTLERTFTLSREKLELDLGNLMLEPDVETLKAVEVTGERSQVVMKVDRRVYNVEKDLSTQGGSAVDVMKNVPGLSVDLDGNVQMRGASPQILVDGRPSSFTLEQIPAEDIERVEIITNPSVAFDANTTGGIINVVLKRSNKPGYSGTLQGGLGTNNRYQSSGNINMKEGPWSFNASANFNTSSNLTDGNTKRTDLSNGQSTGYFNQNNESNATRTMAGGRLGTEWQVSNRNTWVASAGFRSHTNEGEDEQYYSSTGPGGEPISTGEQLNTQYTSTESYNAMIGFRRRSPKPDKEWSADLTYNSWSRSSKSTFTTSGLNADGTVPENSPRAQENLGGSTYDQLSFQLDVAEPLNERTKIEWGAKANWKLDNTYLNVFVTSPQVGDRVKDSTLSNDFRITDIINAVYGNWIHKLNDHWSLQAGLRFEQTWFVTDVLDKDLQFSYKYPNGLEDLERALFPALYLVRRWDDQREVQFNFSRKISRPNFWQIMPFIQISDSRNIRIGNPVLAPELSNMAEVNYLLPFMNGKSSWLTSAFGRYTDGVITQYAFPLPADSNILVSTFVNGDASWSTGWENTLRVEPIKGLQATLSGTVQYTSVALGGAQAGTRNEGFIWNSKLVVSYRMPDGWSMQANGEYEGPRIIPQGTTLPQYGLDLSVSKEFNKRLQAVLSVNDVFYTRRWGNTLETDTFIQENYRRREQRFARLTVTWRFGEQNTSLLRRRQQRREGGGEGDGMEF
ncbi:MAG: TonB-dependent receptor [Flavobacteriales bacterium]|nr:TonB-dependent receptor [Flavobacteriales bacterium]